MQDLDSIRYRISELKGMKKHFEKNLEEGWACKNLPWVQQMTEKLKEVDLELKVINWLFER